MTRLALILILVASGGAWAAFYGDMGKPDAPSISDVPYCDEPHTGFSCKIREAVWPPCHIIDHQVINAPCLYTRGEDTP